MKKKIEKICCIGAGFVGGPTMAVFADKCPNIIVNVVDINVQRIKQWNDKDLEKLPIFEPGLKEIIKRCRNKNLFFSTDVEEQLSCADMIFISVNTPTKEKGIGAGQASDLKWVEISARQISQFAKSETIVVEKSTLPVKTAQTINNILNYSKSNQENSNSEKKFTVLSNPEFLAEGTAINDLINPDRILIGGEDNEAINSLKDLYLNWIDKDKILTTNLWSSELSKLIANALLAQRISSINSFSALCEATDSDIKDVSLAVGLDKRIGKYFLNAGPGFGGSCFKKDISNLIYICNHYGLNEVSDYWQKVLDINNWQQKRITTIIVDKLFGTISGKKLAIFGFAFKANTNDTRESPSKKICLELLEEGAHLSIYDPQVQNHQIAADLNMLESKLFSSESKSGEWEKALCKEDAVKDSDAIIILTEWEEFKHIDWELYSTLMRSPSWVFDTRYICDLKKANNSGFNVWCVGYGK